MGNISTLLKLFFPFLKEMLVGEDKITHVMKKNKVATFLFVVNIFFFALLYYMSIEALENYKAAQEEKANVDKLNETIRKMLPLGVEEPTTLFDLALRFSQLENDKAFYKEQFEQSREYAEKLQGDLETIRRVCGLGDAEVDETGGISIRPPKDNVAPDTDTRKGESSKNNIRSLLESLRG